MQNRLLLTLWLAGGLLYAGSTIFLANTLLGGRPADKAMTIAANEKANCVKDSVAAANADETKTAALAPSKDTPAEAPAAAPAKPEVAPPTEPEANAARPGESAGVERQTDPSEHAATEPGDGAYDPRAPYDRDQRGYDAPAPYDRGDQGAYAPAPYEERPWARDQAGAQPDPGPENVEWAHVIAGTANMRSEPSLQSQLVYALPAGWQVRVISRQPGWVQVQDANSGAAGWVEATAIAPGGGTANGQAGSYGGPQGPYGRGYPRYADEAYPPPPWERRRQRPGEFGEFLRRAFGGF